MEKFKVNDRVRRLPFKVVLKVEDDESDMTDPSDIKVTTTSTRGCLGTIKNLREETTLSMKETKEKTMMVHVLWDNGTLSYLGPEGVEVIA